MSGPTLPGLECPCGSGRPVAACCGPIHRDLGAAVRAEQVMRARYSAFALGDGDFLLRSWDPTTRPPEVGFDDDVTWTGLLVLDVVDGGPGDDAGEVLFEAGYLAAGLPGVLRERSRFRRGGGLWYYLDGRHR